MNCQEILDRLPLHLYGDLAADQAGDVECHLADCASCRSELAALALVRKGLSVTPLAKVSGAFLAAKKVPDTFASGRRWQIAAIAGLAAAIAVLALRCEVRLSDRQLVVRWGAVSEPVREATVIVKHEHEPAPPSDPDARLATVSELIRALAGNVEAGDRERAEQLRKLQQELAALQKENQRRWSETRREVDALYTAQFGVRHSGVNP
jgi:hypothetical protein